MPQMLTIREAAQALGLKPATIRSWVWSRRIGYVKISHAVRIPSDQIERLIESGARPAVKSLQPKASFGKDQK